MACLRIAAIERKSKKHSPNDGSKPKQRSYGIKRKRIYSILVIPVIIQRKQKIHYKTTYTERKFYTLYTMRLFTLTFYMDYLFEQLRKLQNKAIRTIIKSNIKDRITPQYRHLAILKLNDLRIYEIAKFIYQYVHNVLSSQFNNYFSYTHNIHFHETRNSTSKAMKLTRYATNRYENSIKYKEVKIWNSIPNYLKSFSFRKFKHEYKKFLLDKYS